MTFKKVPPVSNEFYHVFNKSIGGVIIFNNLNYLHKILEIVDFYRFDQEIKLSRFNKLNNEIKINYLKRIRKSQSLIDIFGFSFMPNHYHFLIKQLKDNGLNKFISNIQNSYAKYFNLKNNRQGSLFLNSYKYRRIINEKLFQHICRYIHLNSMTSHLIEFEQLENYRYSSYSWYLNEKINRFINSAYFLNYFKSKENFIKFHRDQVKYQRELKNIKDLLLE